MSDETNRPKGSAVPGHRLSRLARFGGLAAGVAGGMLVDGARQLARGHRPSVGDLLLTPANAVKVTDQLAHLRGAAMKVGQLISMDAGDLLPRELADILARLRADAQPMPQRQLQSVLDVAWGKGWQKQFRTFAMAPVAAASIGQVHRARTMDGRDLAIKIQYPGVRQSIDSDVDNVATLLRLSGMIPKTLDVATLLGEAKRQLHEEADYEREGRSMARFAALLANAPDFIVPQLQADLTGPDVLAMTYVEGGPVERLSQASQIERDRVATLLIRLVLRELFEFHLMQTDPNFANYRYNMQTGRIVLLDFGATRSIGPEMVGTCRALLRAGIAGDRDAVAALASELGLYDARTPAHHRDTVLAMIEMAMEPLRSRNPFDFAASDLAARLRDAGMSMATDRAFWHIPPIELMFLQRKIGGVYLLATRLKATVDMASILHPYLADPF